MPIETARQPLPIISPTSRLVATVMGRLACIFYSDTAKCGANRGTVRKLASDWPKIKGVRSECSGISAKSHERMNISGVAGEASVTCESES